MTGEGTEAIESINPRHQEQQHRHLRDSATAPKLGAGVVLVLGLALNLAGCKIPGSICYAYPFPNDWTQRKVFILCCVEDKCESSGPSYDGDPCDTCGNSVCRDFWNAKQGTCSLTQDPFNILQDRRWPCFNEDDYEEHYNWQGDASDPLTMQTTYKYKLQKCGEQFTQGLDKNHNCGRDPSEGPEFTAFVLAIVFSVLEIIPLAMSAGPCCCGIGLSRKPLLLGVAMAMTWLIWIASFVFPASQSCESWRTTWCDCYNCAPKLVELLDHLCLTEDEHSASFRVLWWGSGTYLVTVFVAVNSGLALCGFGKCCSAADPTDVPVGQPMVIGQAVVGQPVVGQAVAAQPVGVAVQPVAANPAQAVVVAAVKE